MIRQPVLRQSLVTTSHTGGAGPARGQGRPCTTDRLGAAEPAASRTLSILASALPDWTPGDPSNLSL